tara:strand:- start:219 stop:410 length:192 start_codon:yes stop_codon:yes gene_type:complete
MGNKVTLKDLGLTQSKLKDLITLLEPKAPQNAAKFKKFLSSSSKASMAKGKKNGGYMNKRKKV